MADIFFVDASAPDGGDGSFFSPFNSIQDAVNAASESSVINLAPGVYEESVTLNVNGLTIVGLGILPDDVVIKGSFRTLNGLDPEDSVAEFLETAPSVFSAGNGITISADDITLSHLTVSEYSVGIALGTNDGLSISDVNFEGNLNSIRKSEAAFVTDFAWTGGSVSDGAYGMNIFADTSVSHLGSFDGVTIDGVSFSNLLEKGLYFEQLSHADITNIDMTDVGHFGRPPSQPGTTGEFGNGIDINLKYHEYTDITISGFDFTNVGTSLGGDATPGNLGAAITVKARDDAPSYSSAPASFDGTLVIENGSIDGTSTAIRAGEVGKNNGGPEISVTNVSVANATHSSAHGDVDNLTQSTMHIDLVDGGQTLDARAAATGDMDVDGGEGTDHVSTGAGDDTFNGAAGSDTFDGRDGTDTAEYAGFVSLQHNEGAWTVFTGEGNPEGIDTLNNVEMVVDAGGTILLVGNGGYATIQEAIDVASAGDTIMVAGGSYVENLTVTKGLTFITDTSVTITSAAGSTPVVTISGDHADGSTSFTGFTFTGATGAGIGQGSGVLVTATNVDTLSFDESTFTGNGGYGLFTLNADIDQLNVTDSGFSSNATNGINSGAHIKLFGFTGDALLQDLTIDGAADMTAQASRPDFGIEMHGVENATWSGTPGLDPQMGNVVIDNVTIGGEFHKSPVAINNYTDISGLSITDLDLSTAEAYWGAGNSASYLFNMDGISDDIDVSGLGVTFNGSWSYAASLLGEHTSQSAFAQTIHGSEGNDRLGGNAGDDTLIGDEGDDMLLGGTGTDTAHYTTNVSAVSFSTGEGNWYLASDGTDLLNGVERVTDADDTFLLVGSGGFATIQAAIDAADPGDTILVAAGTYNENLNVHQEVTIIGRSGAVLQGPLLTQLSIPGGTHVDDFFEDNHPAYTASLGIEVNADNVSISGLTVKGYSVGLAVNTSDNVSITGNTFTDNATALINGTADGFAGFAAQTITNLTVSDNTFTHGVRGIIISAHADGSLDGVTMDDNDFSHLSEKGMYFEHLSNASLTGNTFDDVGNYGRISPPYGGTDGAFGQAVELNYKFLEYTNVTFTDTVITNSGYSNKDGAAASAASGAAINVKLRDDAPTYSPDPATFLGSVVFNGGSIDGTTTGIRVGEPGKSNLGPSVVINGVLIENATVSDVENATHATSGGIADITMHADQGTLDGSLSQATLLVTGSINADTILGGLANDSFLGGAGADSLNGGTGVDAAFYTDATGGVQIRLWNGTGTGNVAAGDVLTSIENVAGSAFNDGIVGADGVANALFGNNGNDGIYGLSGDDTLGGGNGVDTLNGGLGADDMDGGAGVDTVDYSDAAGAVTVRLWNPTNQAGAAAGDTLNNLEWVKGSAFNDAIVGSDGVANKLFGNAGNDGLYGLSGNDTIEGGVGADTINGGDGVDYASYAGSSAGVKIRLWNGTGELGDAQGDVLAGVEGVVGSSHNDAIVGSDGVDNTFFGGLGNDTMYGLTGNDTFYFAKTYDQDVIGDFAGGGAAAGDVIRLLGFGIAFNTFGEVLAAATQVGANTVINFGDGDTLTLTGVAKTSLHANDFLFG